MSQSRPGGYAAQQAIGKNMSNEEYLQALERQNQQKKERELQNKELQQRKKLEEREKGFNVYNSVAKPGGALVPGQGREPQRQMRGARRQWRDPSKSNERGSQSRSPINQFGQRQPPAQGNNAYYNPFDLNPQNQSFADKTNPSALINVFNTRKQNQAIDRDGSPSDMGQQIQIKERVANPNRKKWGSRAGADQHTRQRQQIEMNEFDRDDDAERNMMRGAPESKVHEKAEDDNDEDDYSDDDFEQQVEAGQDIEDDSNALQIIQESTNESRDHSEIQDRLIVDVYDDEPAANKLSGSADQNSSSAHIEQFLKTATAKDMDIIRESLSNFQEVSKNFSNLTSQPKDKDKDDEYIEEEFEEEIPEDNEESDNSNEEHKFEVIKKEQTTAQPSSKASAKGRPVSAVYDLSQFRAGPNTGIQSQRNLHQGMPTTLNANGQSQIPATVKKGAGPKYGFEASSGAAAMAQDALHAKGFETNPRLGGGAHQGSVGQFGSFQPNKPSIMSNAFKRPFSEVNPGKRQAQKAELNRQFLHTDLAGQQTMPRSEAKLQQSMQFNYQTQAGIALRDADNIDASYGGQSQASRLSQRESELHQIMQAITCLDDSQRADLLSILRDKRAAGLGGVASVAGSSRGAGAFGQSAPRAGQSLGYASSNYTATGKEYPSNLSQHTASRSQLNELNHQNNYDSTSAGKHASNTALVSNKKAQDRTRNELTLRVLSTHGDPHLCGLTEIELFDSTAKKIIVLPANVTVRNIGRHGASGANSGIQMSTKALVNGCKFTNEHRNMWIGSLPLPQNPPIHLEVVIHFALSSDLAAIKIWNYNKSVRDSTKGVRDIEILLNDELKFEGVVKMGRGQVQEDYSQLISIQDGVQVEQERLPVAAEENEARNKEVREVPAGAGNISFNAGAAANQIGEMKHLPVHPGNHADAQASNHLQAKQQVSDYRTDYVARGLQPGAHGQQQLVNSNSMQLMQGTRRNIDVIRQRNRNEQSRSRSRSPINDFGKPVWLQSSNNQHANSKSTRLLAGTERQGLIQSKSKEKLNRRQVEQQQRIEQENEPNQNSSLRANADISYQKQVYAGGHMQAPQPTKFMQRDGQRNIPGQEEESAQSNQWPTKGPNRNLENNRSNYGVAEQIFNASELVKNAVSSVNQAVKDTDDQHRGYQKSYERSQLEHKGAESAKAPAKRRQDAQHMIEESLDSFDFFKVTNLGRINNDLGQQSHQRMSKQRGQESENKRAKWGAKAAGTDSARQASNLSTNPSRDRPEPSADLDINNPGSTSTGHEMVGSQTLASEISQQSHQSGKDSITKSSYKAPRLMKSPFPDEFCLPSPALSNKKSASRASVRREKEGNGSRLRDTDRKIEEEEDFLKDLDLNEKQIMAKKAPHVASLDDTFEVELKKYEQLEETAPPVPKQIHAEKTQEQTFAEKLSIFGQPFVIPDLPRGTDLEFNILQTWGDSNYLGLTGIEIFDAEGSPISINGETDIKANPCDINLLMGYGTDPRTVDKLVDGNYFTNDDFHAWLTPFTQGEDHTISIKLPRRKQISMIRIWNYNKSRIHSFRGARLLTCQLDGKTIFKGEIARAPGNTKDPAACCEIILFTDDDDILAQIDQNDWLNQIQLVSDSDDANTNTDSGTDIFRSEQNRPMTATKKFNEDEVKQLQFALNKPTSMFDERPQTKAIRRQNPPPMRGGDSGDDGPNYALEDFKPQIIQKKDTGNRRRTGGIKGRVIELNITESWGDLFYVGLNGIEVYDVDSKKVELNIKNLEANPRDMNSIPGHGQDHRTLDKLINGANNTTDDRNMWLVPFNSGEDHTVKIDLGRMTTIGAIKFYNYNKSSEDSLRGVKQVIIKVDGKLVTPNKGITLRKAPGFILPSDDLMCNDIGQLIFVPFADGWKSNMIQPLQKQVKNSSSQIGLQQEYEPVSMPIGFNFRINLYSTHGDNYYIGLNGIELYDQLGDIVQINAQEQAMVNPAGINRVPGMENDVRTLDKLFNGKNQMFDDRNMWLAPFKFTRSHAAANSSQQNSDKREPNFISVLFDQPTAVSAVRLWNYSKTATRGAHEFEVVVDDKPIYRGFAKKAPDSQEVWQNSFHKDFSTVVLFTHEHRIVERFKNNIDFDPHKQQEVLMFNEKRQVNPGQVKQRPNEKFVFNENERPTTKYGGR